MQKKIHTLLFYSLLLFVYTGFFCVESFFNFEGQPEGRNLTTSAAFSHKSPFAPLTPAAYHSVRLNKRYQQEVIYPHLIVPAAAPPVYAIIRVNSGYRNCVLRAVSLLHRSLRGPPISTTA
jgi:hypothetical protein